MTKTKCFRLWKCNGDCIGWSKLCNNTCYSNWTLNCAKTKCLEEPLDYKCDGECVKIAQPCNGKCPLENQIDCDGNCLKNLVKNLESKKKWDCDGKCLNLTQPCNEVYCANPNWEKNCKGECELEETFYDCNGKCQSVEEVSPLAPTFRPTFSKARPFLD